MQVIISATGPFRIGDALVGTVRVRSQKAIEVRGLSL
jgi:hypothetical protein